MSMSLPSVAGLPILLAATAAVAADADHGKILFETCAACHSDRPDALGPSLKGVYGRPSASLDGFRYSNPMKRATSSGTRPTCAITSGIRKAR